MRTLCVNSENGTYNLVVNDFLWLKKENDLGENVGFIGDLAKTILITWIAFWVLAMMWFAATGQIAMLLLFLVGLLIPLFFIVYEYLQYRKRK